MTEPRRQPAMPFLRVPRSLLSGVAFTEADCDPPSPWPPWKATLDLYAMACWAPQRVKIRPGVFVNLEPGQLAVSESFLAARWRYSRGRVRRHLAGLEAEQQIRQQKSNATTVITVILLHAAPPDSTAAESAAGTAGGQAPVQPTGPVTGHKYKNQQLTTDDREQTHGQRQPRVDVENVGQKLPALDWHEIDGDDAIAAAQTLARQLDLVPNEQSREWLLKMAALRGHGLSEDVLASAARGTRLKGLPNEVARSKYFYRCVYGRLEGGKEELHRMFRRIVVPPDVIANTWAVAPLDRVNGGHHLQGAI